jgi:hypothetical protein
MHPDYVQLSEIIIGTVVMTVFVFYALRLLTSFKNGLLEKGWRFVSIGAISLALAQIPFFAAEFASPSVASFLMIVGNGARLIGMGFLLFGFRAQYEIWRVDKKELPPSEEKTQTISR